ncbi:hypothetical protein LYSIN_00264 [Lysinibacillus sphaericus]|uniref:Uncharacterized protein n=1 Tax=Lysinibacillus sphaericus TaxID=1421 RepID=A0A2S5CXC5_LYSSH|nr:hypothetical protein LYSIN_00264 [Lysinibacillus sphaericus]
MIYRFLLIMATFIFILNLFVLPTFFAIESDNTGTFIGLIIIVVILNHLLKNNAKN